MVKSMTGFGRCQQTLGGKEITVEIRSVNHRYFECSCRLPRSYAYTEERLKKLTQKHIARGKVDVSLSITSLDSGGAEVAIDHALAKGYLEALCGLSDALKIGGNITLADIARFQDIYVVRRPVEDADAVWEMVRQVAEVAIEAFVGMRADEGANLRVDLLSRIENIKTLLARVEQRSPVTVENHRARLLAKMQEVLGQVGVDEGRILQEAAIFAEKVAVDEETVRLRSHMDQFHVILDSPEAIGRKLDFLVQEMNREVNTIGSKAQDIDIAHTVVDIKAEIEKIREQIQNIE